MFNTQIHATKLVEERGDLKRKHGNDALRPSLEGGGIENSWDTKARIGLGKGATQQLIDVACGRRVQEGGPQRYNVQLVCIS